MNANRFSEKGLYTRGVVSYEWQCDACGDKHEDKRNFGPGHEIWNPDLPEGWKTTGNRATFDLRVYCPKHAVVTLVDGKVVDDGATRSENPAFALGHCHQVRQFVGLKCVREACMEWMDDPDTGLCKRHRLESFRRSA